MSAAAAGCENLTLVLLAKRYAVCRLGPRSELPGWLDWSGELVSVTATAEELSIVCPAGRVPEGDRAERDWRAFKVEGPLDFALVGILAKLSGALAEAGISLFALSTYDTDYLLVREAKLEAATAALSQVCRIR